MQASTKPNKKTKDDLPKINKQENSHHFPAYTRVPGIDACMQRNLKVHTLSAGLDSRIGLDTGSDLSTLCLVRITFRAHFFFAISMRFRLL